jgi:amino acid permease
LFEIYESLPNASLDKMNDVIRAAVSLCTAFYICVGFFGYVAFCTQNFSGNYNTANYSEDIEFVGYLSQFMNMTEWILNLNYKFIQDFLNFILEECWLQYMTIIVIQ